MKRITGCFLLICFLTACASSQRSAAGVKFDEAKARCGEQQFSTHLERTRCDNQALMTYWVEMGQDGDIVQLRNAKLEALAEQVDNRTITFAQFQVAEAQILSEAMTTWRYRTAQSEMASAARDQANAAQSMAGPVHCRPDGYGGTFCY